MSDTLPTPLTDDMDTSHNLGVSTKNTNDLLEGLEIIDSSKASGNNSSGAASMVNNENGTRFTISKSTMNEIGNPDSVQIAIVKTGIAVSKKLSDSKSNMFKVAKRNTIYSATLVKRITTAFDLDYSDKTSITFYEVNYITDREYPIAVIKIK